MSLHKDDILIKVSKLPDGSEQHTFSSTKNGKNYTITYLSKPIQEDRLNKVGKNLNRCGKGAGTKYNYYANVDVGHSFQTNSLD